MQSTAMCLRKKTGTHSISFWVGPQLFYPTSIKWTPIWSTPKTCLNFNFSIQEMTQWTRSDDQSKIIENNLQFWRIMPALYKGLNQRLRQKQQGTLGFIFREATANLEFYLSHNDKYHCFVGFNALNESESQIIQEFISRNKGTAYWDIDQHFYKDKVHAAGKFIRQYHKEWKSLDKRICNIFISRPHICDVTSFF